jgi:hypothetical protein
MTTIAMTMAMETIADMKAAETIETIAATVMATMAIVSTAGTEFGCPVTSKELAMVITVGAG